MPVLLDSNPLLRIAQPEAEEYPPVRDAVIQLVRENDTPFICPQKVQIDGQPLRVLDPEDILAV